MSTVQTSLAFAPEVMHAAVTRSTSVIWNSSCLQRRAPVGFFRWGKYAHILEERARRGTHTQTQYRRYWFYCCVSVCWWGRVSVGVSDDPVPLLSRLPLAPNFKKSWRKMRRSPGSEDSLRPRQMRTHLTHASFLSPGLRCQGGFFCFVFLSPAK